MTLGQRLSAAWQALQGTPALPADEASAALQRDLAGLRLDLQEATEALAREQRHTRAQESNHAAAVQQSVDHRLEQLLTTVAAPLAQLRTQGHLLEAGKPVAATDVMLLVNQLAEALAATGLEALGTPGEVTNMDPDTMQALRGAALAPGVRVSVKFVGYRWGDRVVRKALVEGSE